MKELESETIHNEKYLKAKIKSYNGKISTTFHNIKIPKKGSQYVCLSVTLIDSLFRADKNYYPRVFLEEFKYVVNEKKIPEYITDDIEISSAFDREDSDEENYNEESSDEENLLKKIKHRMSLFLCLNNFK